MSYYRYDGLKIPNKWTHPTLKNKNGEAVFFRYARWFDQITDEQVLLDEYGVTRHDDPVMPDYDPATQKRPVLNATGEYDQPVDYTAQELADKQQDTDIDRLQSAGKDTVLVLTELITWILANTNMKGADFSPEVRQAYQHLKTIADRVKG